MSEIKIVFTGTMGAGKSSAISSISDMEVISTDVKSNDMKSQQLNASIKKTTTTVAMDYGEIKLEGGKTVKLYGTPGQQRFNYMWEILSKGAMGIIILVDARSDDPLKDLELYMDNFKQFIDASTVVIGVTHVDVSQFASLEILTDYLRKRDLRFPLFPVDARNPDEVKVLIETLVALLQTRTTTMSHASR